MGVVCIWIRDRPGYVIYCVFVYGPKLEQGTWGWVARRRQKNLGRGHRRLGVDPYPADTRRNNNVIITSKRRPNFLWNATSGGWLSWLQLYKRLQASFLSKEGRGCEADWILFLKSWRYLFDFVTRIFWKHEGIEQHDFIRCNLNSGVPTIRTYRFIFFFFKLHCSKQLKERRHFLMPAHIT